MKLDRQVSLALSAFSFVLIVWNLATPFNPDHNLNLYENALWSVLFMLSFWAKSDRVCHWLQLIPIALSAFIAASTDGGLFFSGIITVFWFVLLYTYGGFKTNAIWKLPLSVGAIFSLCAIASAKFTLPGLEALGRAAMWTLLVIGHLFFLWRVVRELERQFHEGFAASLIKNNRQLLEELKQQSKGCKDGDDA